MSAASIKQEIIKHIGSSYANYRVPLARKILKEKIPLKNLFPVLYLEHPISTRFSWLLGDISMIDPSKSKEIIIEGFKNFDRIHILNFDRTIAKQCMICGNDLPQKLEGEIVDRLFYWLNTPSISIATKYYAMLTLFNLCRKYPDLKNELIVSIQAQLPHSSKALKNCGNKILTSLKVDKE
ncbi:MAG: hypothetical protein IPO63_03380 [Bacteroidetes bacterium]|nr:hypothetical protein [Bacteroidota bacterium]